ncbi:MAG: oligosaccharide flippase family protein [Phycisphaerales bacterium JB065]
MSLGARVITGLLWQMASRGGDKLLRMGTNVLLARVLVPEDFGLMQAAFLALGAIECAAFLASDQAIVHYDRGADRSFLNTVFWIAAIRGAIIAVLVAASSPLIAAYFEYPDQVALFAVIAFQPLLLGLASPRAQVLVKDLDFKRFSTYRLASTAIGMGLSVGLAFALRSAWALVLGQMMVMVAQTILSYAVAPFRPRLAFDRETWIAVKRYGLSAAGTPLLLFFINGAPTLLLGKLVSLSVLGAFSLNQKLARLPLDIAHSAVGAVVMPAYAALKDNPERLAFAWLRALRGVCLIALPLCVVMTVADSWVGRVIFGAEYEQQPGVFAVLVFGGFLNMLLATVGPIFWAIGRPSLDRACQVPRVLVLFGLGFALVPGMGGMGMAVAMAMSSGIALLFGYRSGLRVVQLSWFDPFRYCADLLVVGLVASVALGGARWLPGLSLPLRITAFGLVSILYAVWTLRAVWSMYTQIKGGAEAGARPA